MLEEFKKRDIKICQVQYCPHTPNDNCSCRKPEIGMIKNILTSFDINLEESWLIGDKKSDIQCAINANIKNTIQVLSGHKFDKKNSIASFVIESIKNVDSIIKK
jgi:D-glycero-D-manno-heptose 1,7-bisphosphate phosphatase